MFKANIYKTNLIYKLYRLLSFQKLVAFTSLVFIIQSNQVIADQIQRNLNPEDEKEMKLEDNVIYSVYQEVPLQDTIAPSPKNYYINMGLMSGLEKNSTVSVYRTYSVNNNYRKPRRERFKIKVGTLKIIHAEEYNAIGIMHSMIKKEEQAALDANSFQIGDHVKIEIQGEI